MRKRLSNDNSSMSKRAKSTEDKQKEKVNHAIDSIPLRSTPKTLASNPASVLGPFGTQKKSSPFPRPLGIATSFSAYSASPNTSFSTASGCNSPLDDSGSDYFTSQESPYDSEKEIADAYIPPETLCTRLKGVWPGFLNETFNGAPLAVIWEITRIALHCGVELTDCDVLYDDISQWSDQSNLRNALSQLPAFHAKSMPQLSSHDAWDLALKGFQSTTYAVILSAELVLNRSSTGPLFSLKLHPLRLQQSHRLSRRFGADRFLEILMPYPDHVQKVTKSKRDNVSTDAIISWLTEKHYFLGRRWTAFCCRPVTRKKVARKDAPAVPQARVFFFASDGDSFEGCPDGLLPPIAQATTPGIRTKMPVHKLMDWAIGGLSTTNQQVPKLFSRITLSLSHTHATVVLEKHQIHSLNYDIGTHSTMNDGIGRISKALATKIASKLGLTDLPCAFQARLGSAKGMWIIDSDPTLGDGDWIVTYASQVKWDCDYEDSHHRTFEVKEWPKEPRSASLNQQFIPVLEAQAINPAKMRKSISTHLRRGLLEELAAQKMAIEDPVEMRLWLQQGGGSKPEGSDHRMAFLGGLPRDKQKEMAFLLDSGFHPKSCKYLQERCWLAVKGRTDFLKAKMNICVPCSAYLLMVVDFSSTLEEDEVHVSFSTKFQVDGFCDTLLEEMDVLVARAPSHLPSDIQRVKVVSRPQLRHLKNVIVFSTKGRSSLADKLSGGDYDGDRAWVCWDQEIVQNFYNAAVPDDDTDPEKLGHLRKLNRSTAQIRQEETGDEAVCSKFLRESLAFNMQQSILGKCTDYKERYCYHTKSISTKNILILSRLLGCLVDQPKQGYIFTNSDWHQFRQNLQIRTLEHDPEYKLERASYNISKQANPHILDYLRHVVAERTVAEALTELTKILQGYKACHYDEHLTRMFNFYDHLYDGQYKLQYNDQYDPYGTRATWVNVRDALKEDIESVAKLWKNTFDKHKDYVAIVGSIYQQWCQIEPLSTESSSDLVKLLRQPYMEDSQSTLWELLKASFAFKELCNGNATFVWQMAGRQLAMLKSMMSHSAAMTACVRVVPELYGVLKPDKKLIATRRTQRLAEKPGIYDLSAGDLEALQWHDDVDMDEEMDD